MTFSLKAYTQDYKVVVNDTPSNDGEFVNAISDVVAVEKLALEVPEFVGHAFGTNTFTIFFQNGGASIYRYQDFTRIDIQPLSVEEPVPEFVEATAEDAAKVEHLH